MTSAVATEDLLRDLAPRVLGALVRRHGEFDACEDAVQEALLAAALQWPTGGIPDDPRAWLIRVASRRRIETWRRDEARRRREMTAADLLIARDHAQDPAAVLERDPDPDADDTLTLFLLCCHPALSTTSQVALTLRAVGGLTTAEISRALLVPETTVGQRISRAKQRIRSHGATFTAPPPGEVAARLRVVMHVLYLIFTEGSTASSGSRLHRVELSAEAIRLARQLHAQRPDDGEVAGLLALMLLTDARRPARTGPDGGLIPLEAQDRARWDRRAIAEGVGLVTRALATTPLGAYQLQAAIAAVHDEAPRFEDTDWREILGLYDLLARLAPGPMVTLNRIVALAMVHGPAAGLERLAGEATGDPGLADHYRTDAVRAHLQEMAGDPEAARQSYVRAARRTHSLPERRYLEARAGRIAGAAVSPGAVGS